MSSNYLLFCLFGIVSSFVAITVGREAIIGGEVATKRQFPYQASIFCKGIGYVCGGGIIADQFILTAAHCILTDDNHIRTTHIKVLVGSNNLLKRSKPDGMLVDVKTAFVLTEYRQDDVHGTGDIAVLKLRYPLELKENRYLKPLQLPEDEHENYAGKKAIVAGFGWNWIVADYEKRTKNGGFNDTRLRFTQATVVRSGEECSPPGSFCDKHLFARSDQHSRPRGVCYGDSGSPLVNDDKTVIGILSMSPFGCIEKEFAATYTRVSSYLDFIRDVIHDHPHDHIRVWQLQIKK